MEEEKGHRDVGGEQRRKGETSENSRGNSRRWRKRMATGTQKR